jgi:hypothetical protein
VLSRLEDDFRCAFVNKLTSEWLRGKRFELLYRGSRDGMTPKAFHDNCDEKGPTLVLIAGQSEGQPVCVFGGYAGKSWESVSGRGKVVDARNSFVFTVSNPFGDGIVKMPVNEASAWARETLKCHVSCGPWFGSGFVVGKSKGFPDAAFDQASGCWLNSNDTFGDPLGRGKLTLTGSQYFTPVEMEVWSVC